MGAWIEAMRAGDFERAWLINDADLLRLRTLGAPKHEGPRHLQRIWRGEPLHGRRVLVRCYHGLGDTIQFARFLRPLRAIATRVGVWCPAELVPLIAAVDGVDEIEALNDGAPTLPYEVDIEIMELAHALRADRTMIGMQRSYLPTPPRSPRRVGTRRVGLVWQAGEWDVRRSVPPQLLASLGCVPGIELISLQCGGGAVARDLIPASDGSTPDLCGLCAVISTLDLVITVDTMVAHLAGALEQEVWVPLHTDCDWRWPRGSDRTLWYPTMRLFHQRVPGDWRTPVAAMVRVLTERAAAISAPSGQDSVVMEKPTSASASSSASSRGVTSAGV